LPTSIILTDRESRCAARHLWVIAGAVALVAAT
jgi:hypothetical protein